MTPPKRAGLAAAITVLIAGVWLVGSSFLRGAEAQTQPARKCTMDPVEESICIYEAILADVAKTYRPRGGGGISSIVQKSTTTFEVQISQEGRKDILTYTVDVSKDGKVRIVEKKEGTKSY